MLLCSDMISSHETEAFFQQLLHDLLSNLQTGSASDQELQDSPLRQACKDVLPAICQILGPEQYLQQALQSVNSLMDAETQVNLTALEVRCSTFC